ncbi:DUF6177 family protein [Curtobacterium sp. Leaf261]|uniref:DUF6177 family protein n=1 Tax=Curtobacterium sp. Leaf261 TaxID=1736311 RepID=UPI0006FA2A8E|nr:DUF6177 family protein [Curtobacterium sp. Leaf261]KQO61340.1 hypothetical protein ASF23_12705 [Curtobacterium sp. Leaf261]
MVRHPLIDDVVGSAIVVESASSVVWLTDAFSSLLTRAAAAGRLVVLRTGAEASLTPALRHALGATGAAWVVTDFDGSMRDGRTGVAAGSIEDFIASGPELHGVPSPEHRVAADAVQQVSIDLTLRHHPDREVGIGGAIEALCAAAGCVPTRWGTGEPLSVPWDRWVVTQYAKHEAPDVSTSYAIGEGMSATMTAHMTDGFVIETVSAILTAPAGGVDGVLDAVRDVADDVVPVFGVVMERRGDADHMVRAVSYGEPTPAAVVVGPEASRFLDRAGVWPPPQTRTELFGEHDHEGLLVRFDDGWNALESFLDRIDEDRFVALVGGAPLDEAAADGAPDDHGTSAFGGLGAP